MELQIIWGVVIAVWVVLGLLVGNMMRERLREFTREFFGASQRERQQPRQTGQVAPGVRGRGSWTGLRGRPAYEGRSRSVPRQ